MSDESDPRGPLTGLMVLDLSRVLTGPFAAMTLGDLGARVVKVERPGRGDETRQWGPPFVGEGSARTSSYFMSVNRNKESIALDFGDPRDRIVLGRLLERADIVVENFRPGVLDRIGLSHEQMQLRNPAVVIVSITGFGHDGPRSDRAGYDQIIQGEAGLMSITGSSPDQPTKAGVPIADLSAGMFGVIGALAALQERTRTGLGRVVHTSLLSSVIGLHTFQGTRWLVGGDLPQATGNEHPTVAPYGAFWCKDQRMLQVAIGNDALWKRFADVLGIDHADTRFSSNELRRAHRAELDGRIADLMATHDRDHWLRVLDDAGVPNGAIKSLDEVYRDPQVLSQHLVTQLKDPDLGVLQAPGSPIRFDETDPPTHRVPPRFDEHGEQLRAWVADDAVPLRTGEERGTHA